MRRINDTDRTKILNAVNLTSLLTKGELDAIHKIAEVMDLIWKTVKAREDLPLR